MNALRQKAISKGLGSGPPSWVRSGLGKADRDPNGLLSGLGLSRFQGAGDDWMQDIYNLLRTAQRSSILVNVFYEPQIYRSQQAITIRGTSDLSSFSSTAMMRMIRSILWAAEQQGKIAMPSRLQTFTIAGNTAVQISIG